MRTKPACTSYDADGGAGVRRSVQFGMKSIAAITAATLILGAGVAQAAPSDNEDTVCRMLSALNGDPAHDTNILETVGSLVAAWAGESPEEGGAFIERAVDDRCPQYWPKVKAAIGSVRPTVAPPPVQLPPPPDSSLSPTEDTAFVDRVRRYFDDPDDPLPPAAAIIDVGHTACRMIQGGEAPSSVDRDIARQNGMELGTASIIVSDAQLSYQNCHGL
jgi:hypothetical protein